MAKGLAIGIDLGTTNSCVGVYLHGKVDIIVNDRGKKTTPSFVAFTNSERLIGNPAKDQAVRNFSNTIFDVKRIIGRKFYEKSVQADIKHWPFQVIDDNTEPKIKVEVNGQTRTFRPEEISSMVLAKIKEIAEDYLGETVKHAVITVPANFNDSQRQATKDAATIAGLDVLRIINEPTAAAIAYGMDKKISENRYVLIFDLGGGTFDVSILNLCDGVNEVKSTAGDPHLGGEDFDSRMVNHFVLEFKRKHQIQADLFQNRKFLQRLSIACEGAKKTLSTTNQTYIEIDSLYNGIDFCSTITRAHFEELNADLFQILIEKVEVAIRDAKIGKDEIDDVVLVGGSSRIPKVQQLIRDFFEGEKLKKSINPDEAVAYGAAVLAAKLHGDESKEIDIVLLDVTPLSLGIGSEKECRTMRVIIERNTTIPTRKSVLMTMFDSNLTTAEIPVYEGEHDDTADNNLLGVFDLDDIPPAPQGEAKIDVTFDIDANGILNVSAAERKTGVRNQINISYSKNRLSEDEINRMIKEAEEFKILEKKRKLTIAAKCDLESYCVNMKKTVEEENLKDKIEFQDKKMILKTCNETIHWLRSNKIGTLNEYESKRKELEGAFSLIISLAKEPDKKEEKYREILNIKEGASKKEISEAYRKAVKKYHPDVCDGNKEIGGYMFRMCSAAYFPFLSHGSE